jgi:hypothetical protein
VKGDEHDRADVVRMVVLHLDQLWAELTDRINLVERQPKRERCR